METDDLVDAICSEFERQRPLYDEFALCCHELVEKLLVRKGLKDLVHSVTRRTKLSERLREKLMREDKHYSAVTDVTDLAGLRIITYFADDVDKVASVIEREFKIDEENSVDKRAVMDPDRFGYLSLHYVCALTDERTNQTENEPFRGLLCEVQIRSILQHAWAEMEHDLGYETREAVPRDAQRRFAKLAGLLEVADDEFGRLRTDLRAYARDVDDRIERTPDAVLIDKVSLLSYIGSDKLVIEIDSELADLWGAEQAAAPAEGYVESLVPLLLASGFDTISDLRNSLLANRPDIVEHSRRGLTRSAPRRTLHVPRGVSLFRFSVLLLARQRDAEKFAEVWRRAGRSLDNVQRFAQEAIDALPDSPAEPEKT